MVIMNKQRRQELRKIHLCLTTLLSDLESVKGDEELAFDNMPENLQYSARGEESQDAIDSMDSAIEVLSEVIDKLQDVIDDIEEVI